MQWVIRDFVNHRSRIGNDNDARIVMAVASICRASGMKILIPTPLRQYAGKQDKIEMPAQTVGEALAGLTAQYSDLRRHLFTDEGKLRAFVNVYLNDEDIRYLQKENTPVRDSDTLSIVPSIAGGCCCCCPC